MVDIIVCIKQIFDLGQIKVDATSNRPITEGAARKLATDKNALEETLRIKEKHGGNVLALIGGTKEAAKEALAMVPTKPLFTVQIPILCTATILRDYPEDEVRPYSMRRGIR